jgi:hypothetical protein
MAAGDMIDETGWRQPHRWVIVVVLGVFTITGLATFGFAAHNAESLAKAEQLSAELQAAGLRAPQDPQAVADVLGTDGGPVCDDPAGALRKALVDSQLVNGAASVGIRPVIAAENVVRGALVVLDVYCPDVADEVRARIDEYKLDDTAEA